jgi:diadenylate cyclase
VGELLNRLFAARPFDQVLRDLLDIVIVAWVIYRALLVLRGTRAIQMAVGLGIVSLVYLGAKVLKLATLLSLLSSLLSSIVLIVVVVFQNDIRRALIRVGNTAWFTGGREQQSRVIDEVVAAATELARHRMGALIAFEQDANVLEFAKSEGIQLDSVVTRELLVSLFVPESVNKLHDGAVLIRDLKIARAGVFFPMPDTKVLDAQLGSRHRAALGITEETDAVVVVVSEERGTISFCFSGNIVSNLDGQSLRHALLGLFGRTARKKRPGKKGAGVSGPVSQIRPPAHDPSFAPKSTSFVPGPSSMAPGMAPSRSSTTLMSGSPPVVQSAGGGKAVTPGPGKLMAPVTMPMRSSGEAARRDPDAAPPSTGVPPSIAARPGQTFVPTSPARAPAEPSRRTSDEGPAPVPGDEDS